MQNKNSADSVSHVTTIPAPDRADVNRGDQFFWTPIHHAAHAGHVEIVELLVKAGADVNAQSLDGGTPLIRAIESGQSLCVHFLVKAGANVYLENKKGTTSKAVQTFGKYVGFMCSHANPSQQDLVRWP